MVDVSPDTGVAASLRRWLLQAPLHPLVDATESPHCGVLGQVGEDAYLYPEIAGYYLHWLARQPREHSRLAEGVIRWLVDWAQAPTPPARIALRPGADWRAAGLFAFDLAMLRRGCARWPHLALAATLTEAIDRLLLRLIDQDGQLRAVRANAPLPQRWSTNPGAYQAKVVVALLDSDLAFALSTPVARATQRLANEVLSLPSHPEHHPELYAIEGMLALDPPQAARRLSVLLERLDDVGWLPESSATSRRRTDVQAQAIRAARALGLAERPRERMACTLAMAVRSDGSLPFDPDDPGAPANTWCALFASEALLGPATGDPADSAPPYRRMPT